MGRDPPTPPLLWDPASLGDPLATKTAWTPCKKGGSSFCTHRVRSQGEDRLVFRPTALAVVVQLLALGMGITLIAAIPSLPVDQAPYLYAFFLLVVTGPLLLFIATRALWSTLQPRVFDRRLALFARGWSEPRRGAPGTIELGKIHALQVITEVCRGSKSGPFRSYELNLVLADGKRVNVVDHGDLPQLREDAEQLTALTGLGSPLTGCRGDDGLTRA